MGKRDCRVVISCLLSLSLRALLLLLLLLCFFWRGVLCSEPHQAPELQPRASCLGHLEPAAQGQLPRQGTKHRGLMDPAPSVGARSWHETSQFLLATQVAILLAVMLP